MKKFITLALVLGFLSPAMATNLGVKAGVGLTNFSTDPDVGGSSGTRFMGGAALELDLAESVYFQPEVLYTSYAQSGATSSLDYLAVPMLLKAKFAAGAVSPFLVAGPALGLRLSSATGSVYKSINFSLDFGGGLEIPAGSVAVTLDVRYSLGLTNTLDTTTTLSQKTKALQFLAGVSFPL